ncbi:MAG TPA: anti-sigma regulatory factor [Polyangiales bacterium]|nr:anti-sigma regulatory factor [Polyangiales bacterium]
MPASEPLQIRDQSDVVRVRHAVRSVATELGFSVVDQTKIVTAASELARNTLVHGKGGHCVIEALDHDGRKGLKLSFEDQGPGIPDIAQALKDGYTSGDGMGLGLGGAKRLMSEFEIVSSPGQGTRVSVTRWKP